MRNILPVRKVKQYISMMEEQEVSEVARSPRGFLKVYFKNNGDPNRIGEYWMNRREGFIARHMAQVENNKEPLIRDGKPTRRHLALIAWAYSPTPSKI